MSYTFSRRDFMKYSALTVVAVAGAGLLSGCEIQDPNNPIDSIGTTFTLGTTTAQLTPTNTGMDGYFNLRIANGSDSPLLVNDTSLYIVTVNATDAEGNDSEVYNSAYAGNGIEILNQELNDGSQYPNLAARGDVTLSLHAKNFPEMSDGRSYTVVFRYIPLRNKTELSMRWKWTSADLSDGE